MMSSMSNSSYFNLLKENLTGQPPHIFLKRELVEMKIAQFEHG
jgi:hypothetical protein